MTQFDWQPIARKKQQKRGAHLDDVRPPSRYSTHNGPIISFTKTQLLVSADALRQVIHDALVDEVEQTHSEAPTNEFRTLLTHRAEVLEHDGKVGIRIQRADKGGLQMTKASSGSNIYRVSATRLLNRHKELGNSGTQRIYPAQVDGSVIYCELDGDYTEVARGGKGA